MAKKQEVFTLLTFYKFVDVENPKKEVEEHSVFTRGIWMKGRIYIGTEGISATVTWNEGQIMAYKLYLQQHELFNNPDDLDIKSCKVQGHQFPKMKVKVRDEIVVLWKKYSKQEIEAAGNFKELEEKVEEYKKEFWDKKVISYCTGWIRCEKSTVMLQKAGLKNTYQLDWGVVKYINTFDDGNWEGNLYVFDDRVSDHVWSEKTHTVIWECCYTWEKTDHCENCRYSPCNARLICTPKAYKKHFGFCSQECLDSAKTDFFIKDDAPFDSMNYKMKRSEIKIDPSKKEEIFEALTQYLNKKLAWVEFNNKLSLREEYHD